MRTLHLASTFSVAAISAFACSSEVPIGQGPGGSAGAAGSSSAVGGNAGSSVGGGVAVGGSAGSTSAVGGAGGVATGGVGGIGGGSSTGGAAGSSTGGVGGSAGGSATGGGPATCPTTGIATEQLPAPDVSDVLIQGQLYWSQSSANEGGSIHRREPSSGAPVELASKATYPSAGAAFDRPDSLAANGGFIYWRARAGRSVWRVPALGGTPTEVASIPGAFSGDGAGLHDVLAIESGTIYWVQGPNPMSPSSIEYALYSAPTNGGAPTKLRSYVSNAALPSEPFLPISLDADATSLFFGLLGDPSSSKLVKMNQDGSSPTDLFGIGQYVFELNSDVYMTSSGALWRVPKSGGSSTLVKQGLDKAKYFEVSQGIAHYAGTFYVSAIGTDGSLPCCTCGWIWTANANDSGDTAVPLWSGTGRPTALAVSPGVGLAFADADNDEVVVIPLGL